MLSVGAELFALSDNAMHVASFVTAVAFAGAAVALNWYKKSAKPLDGPSVFFDLLRGASIFPLFLFVLTPIMPGLGKLAMSGDPVLLSLGAANGLFALISDWWRNI